MTIHPCVSNGVLIYSVKNKKHIIRVESNDWWNWLSDQNVRMFRYESPWGSFTAQREQQNGRLCWYALFLKRGNTYKQYLGEFTELTAKHLLRSACLLKKHCLPSHDEPLSSVSPSASNDDIENTTGQVQDTRLYNVLPVTRLKPPSLRPYLISRPQLIEKLYEGVRRKLTLLSAPAGSGKTTTLSLLYTKCTQEKKPIAWLTLDEKDNGLERFMAYMIAALDAIYPGIQESLQPLLYAPTPSVPRLLAVLINTIDAQPRDFVFVLDSYQVVTAPEIHEVVAFLLDHAPEHMHLLLSTRTVVPFPLARLRASGQVTELYKADLCFTLDETITFFHQTLHAHVPKEVTTVLHDYAEGWITGIQLISQSLVGDHRQSQSHGTSLIGDQQHLIEYFHEEVFSRHSPCVQNFLLATSLVESVNSSLCNALTEQSDGQAMLKMLEQTNHFITAVDNKERWYRYHPMFRYFLRYVLYHTHPDHIAMLEQRALLWYKQQHMVPGDLLKSSTAPEDERTSYQSQLADEALLNSNSMLLANLAPCTETHALSRREVEIVQYITIGLSNQEVARRMCIAESTVRWYIKNIYLKLDVHNRVQLVIRARELHIAQEKTAV